MDYQRRERQVTYHSPSCKMYLRHDFKHRCAYCGIIEEILSPVPSARELLFEIDHFLPQDSGTPDVHKYSNLYYSCKKCNGLKDNKRLPLDPCTDDIWYGDCPQFEIRDADKDYFVEPKTPAAEHYAEILQLNSRFHIEVREELKRQISRKQERERLLAQLETHPGLDPTFVSQIRAAVTPISSANSVESLCGTSAWARSVVTAYNILSSKGYGCEIVFNDFPHDVSIVIDGIEYHAQLRINKTQTACRISCELLSVWQKSHPQMGILQYVLDTQSILFYKIDYGKIDPNKKTHLFSDCIAL